MAGVQLLGCVMQCVCLVFNLLVTCVTLHVAIFLTLSGLACLHMLLQYCVRYAWKEIIENGPSIVHPWQAVGSGAYVSETVVEVSFIVRSLMLSLSHHISPSFT